MSSICGIFYKKGQKEEGFIELMAATMLHGCACHSGYYSNNYISLANNNYIANLHENENQPATSDCGRYLILFDGLIHNLKELGLQYGFEPKLEYCKKILLNLFVLKGENFIYELNGTFAITIYDVEKNSLYLYRDRLGIKPLYYYDSADYFIFGSELKSITKLPLLAKRLEIKHNSIGQFLHLGYIPMPNTIYKDIYKLEQGSILKISTNGIDKRRWWKIDENVITNLLIANENEALEQLDILLNSSVCRNLYSTSTVGTLLSGGVDSSLVTAIAAKNYGKQLNTFCIKFDFNRYDESYWAAKIAEYLRTNHHYLSLTVKDATDYLPIMIKHYDEPYGDTSAIPSMLASKFASKKVGVALLGDGGDELFHGYGSYKWAERLHRPLIMAGKPLIEFVLKAGNNHFKRAAWMFHKNSCLEPHIFSQEQSFFSASELPAILNFSELEIWRPEFFKTGRKLTPAERQSIFDLSYYLPDDLVTKVDKAGRYFGLEMRAPLLDQNILEFALNLSPKLKIKNGTSKYLLKQLLNRYIPQELTNRPKQGFAMPLKEWMKNEMKDFFLYYLSSEVLNKYNIINLKTTQKLINKFYNSNQSYLYNRLWLIAALNMWLFQLNPEN